MARCSGRLPAGLGVPTDPRGAAVCHRPRYANEKRYRLGYIFAQRAAEIPLPEEDMTIPHPDLYAWRAAECAGDVRVLHR